MYYSDVGPTPYLYALKPVRNWTGKPEETALDSGDSNQVDKNFHCLKIQALYHL